MQFPENRTTRNDRRSRTIRYRDTSPEIVIVTGDISRIRSRFTFSRLSRHSYRLLYATSDKRPFYRVGTTAIDSGDCQSKRENLDFSSVPREETVKCNLSVRSRKKRKRSVLFIPFERNPRKSLLLNKRKRKNLIKSKERERELKRMDWNLMISSLNKAYRAFYLRILASTCVNRYRRKRTPMTQGESCS